MLLRLEIDDRLQFLGNVSYIFEIYVKFCVFWYPSWGGFKQKFAGPLLCAGALFCGLARALSKFFFFFFLIFLPVLHVFHQNETTAGWQDPKKFFITNQLTLVYNSQRYTFQNFTSWQGWNNISFDIVWTNNGPGELLCAGAAISPVNSHSASAHQHRYATSQFATCIFFVLINIELETLDSTSTFLYLLYCNCHNWAKKF
jgi:hypothetical protein